MIITGKIFEYITSGNPVIGIGPLDGDACAILRNTGAGKMFDYHDTPSLSHYIQECFENWRHSTLQDSAPRFPQFERETLTGELASVFNQCTAPCGTNTQ